MSAKPISAKGVLTKKQGYMRARGGQVDFYMPGVYTGPMIEAGRAERIARKGIADATEDRRHGRLTRLRIPGHYDGSLPPDQALVLFRRMLKAALEAKRQHDNQHVLVLGGSGKTRYVV